MRLPLRPLEEPYRSRAAPPGSARYWSWLFSAPDSREPLLGIYALLAEWQALMDPATESAVAHLKLAWWEEEMQRLTAGSPVHPVSRYLAEGPRGNATDFAPLKSTVRAAAAHVAGAPIERSEELTAHSTALLAGPLMVAARLAGGCTPETEAGVRRCVATLAAAEYLKRAIADYRREARVGRVSFPVDELLAAKIEDADLCADQPPLRLQSYLDEVRRRAAQFFATAGEALPRAERAPLRHLLVLAALGVKHLNGRAALREPAFRLQDLYLAWTTARRAALST
jgi:15-cis-phytoene synthase